MGSRYAASSAPAAWLARVIAAAVVLSSLVGCERAKTRMDREVDRLCAIDGGVHIYETVTLPKEDFGKDGEVFPQYRHLYMSRGHLGPDYVPILELQVLIEGSPSLQRDRVAVQRRRDNKVLGEFVNYKRSGGDWPGPWEPSQKSCAQVNEANSLYRRVFLVANGQRRLEK